MNRTDAMLPPDQTEKQDRRVAGDAQCPQAKVPTYQELLDQALDDTFPASDPVAISAARHAHEPRTTPRDRHDWTLKPGACPAVGQPCGDGHGSAWSARCPAQIAKPFRLNGLKLPAGACELQQSADSAVVLWMQSGAEQEQRLDLELLQRLLSDGQLVRLDPA